MSQMIQVHVPNFFYFAKILKMTELRPKNRFFGPEIPKDSKKAKTEEDSYSGICQQKLLTKAMFKPLGYDVHNVHISVYIGDWVSVWLAGFVNLLTSFHKLMYRSCMTILFNKISLHPPPPFLPSPRRHTCLHCNNNSIWIFVSMYMSINLSIYLHAENERKKSRWVKKWH